MTRIGPLGLHEIVAALGGDLQPGGCRAQVPAPGHSPADRSVSLLLDGDRVVIHGFGAAYWREVRAHLLSLRLIDATGRLTGGAARAEPGHGAPARPSPHVRIAAARTLWSEAYPLEDGDLCHRYLRLRGVQLRSRPDDLRRHPGAPISVFRRTDRTCPAMMAAIRTSDGALSAVEIAYLGPDGRTARHPRLPRKTVGAVPAGSAVRLSSPGAAMVVGEGVATTLSAMKRFDLPGWALLSAGNLARWSPPEGVGRILIAGDRGRAGEAAAAELCERLKGAGLAVEVCLPPSPYGDWNEAAVLEEEEGRGGAPAGRG